MINVRVGVEPSEELSLWGNHFRLNLTSSIKDKIKQKENPITTEVLKALKNIERTSKVKAFITNPVVLLITGAVVGAIGVALAVFSNAIAVGTLALSLLLGGGLLVAASGGTLFQLAKMEMRNLYKVSQAYDAQANHARLLISQISEIESAGHRLQIILI